MNYLLLFFSQQQPNVHQQFDLVVRRFLQRQIAKRGCTCVVVIDF